MGAMRQEEFRIRSLLGHLATGNDHAIWDCRCEKCVHLRVVADLVELKSTENKIPRVALPFTIETTVTIDGQTIHRRYEAPSQDEVVKLAERCGEVLEPVTQTVEIKT